MKHANLKKNSQHAKENSEKKKKKKTKVYICMHGSVKGNVFFSREN
jgi:CheY-specific phosphatase CheX